jgi:aspartyl-tRNA(Asn)/glutamyl-tRNA(Gln) amidotransferase subunit A
MTQPNTLSITAAAEQIRTGQLSPVELVRACLDRIDQREPQLQAWVTLDAQAALAEAEACHTAIRQGHYRGLLHGIPIGLKDIFFHRRGENHYGLPDLCRLCTGL